MRNAYALLVLLFLVGFSTTASAQCTSCNLFGVSTLQQDATTTFSTTALSGTSYFWSVTGGLQIVGSNTGTSVTVKAISGTSGKVSVARYGNGRIPCSYTRTISITSNTCTLNSVTVVRTSGACGGRFFTYQATASGSNLGSVNYNWEALGSNVSIVSGQGSATVTIRANDLNTPFIGARATVNACGTTKTGVSADLCEFDDCGDFICLLGTAPNPSSNGFVVTLEKGSKALSARVAPEYTIQLLNKHGQVVKEVKTQDTKIYIDTQDVDNGMYIIRALHASGQSKTTSVMVNK